MADDSQSVWSAAVNRPESQENFLASALIAGSTLLLRESIIPCGCQQNAETNAEEPQGKMRDITFFRILPNQLYSLK